MRGIAVEGGWGLACLRRERKPPCSVLYVVPLTRTLYAGGTKVRVDNGSRYLTLARVKRLRRESDIYAAFDSYTYVQKKWSKCVFNGNDYSQQKENAICPTEQNNSLPAEQFCFCVLD